MQPPQPIPRSKAGMLTLKGVKRRGGGGGGGAVERSSGPKVGLEYNISSIGVGVQELMNALCIPCLETWWRLH